MGAGEPSTSRPNAIKVEEATTAGQVTGPQAAAPAKPPIPRKVWRAAVMPCRLCGMRARSRPDGHLCCAQPKFVPRMPARKDPLAAKAAAAAVPEQAPGPAERAVGAQQPVPEEHRDLLRAAAADKAWQRGGKNRPQSLEGRPKQPSFTVTSCALLVPTAESQLSSM